MAAVSSSLSRGLCGSAGGKTSESPARSSEGARPQRPGARADAGLSRLPSGRGCRGTGPAAAPQQGEPGRRAGTETDLSEASRPTETAELAALGLSEPV